MDLKKMADYYNTTEEMLKRKSYADLEIMMEQMKEDLKNAKCQEMLKDEEYTRLVRKFFTPYEMLRKWFSDEEIIIACANQGVTEKDLCDEEKVVSGRKCYGNNAELVGTGTKRVSRNDMSNPACKACVQRIGSECAYGCPYAISTSADVYRVKARYQGLSHGKVILSLLYSRRPELAKYGFSAYEYYGYDKIPYEIYPSNDIYSPLDALMQGDVEAIKKRNLEYSKSYNHGKYTEEETLKRFEENKEFFETISKIAG